MINNKVLETVTKEEILKEAKVMTRTWSLKNK